MDEKAIGLLRKYTNHNNVILTDRGNTAIEIALHIAQKIGKTHVFLANQGGWLTYKKYAAQANLEVIELTTDYGIIDTKDLQEKLDSKSVLLIQNMAGYFAQQPIEKISKICKDKKALFILDVSDSIYANGDADIHVSSFGNGKPVNLGYGGFISLKQGLIKGKFDFDSKKLPDLCKKLENLKERLDKFDKINKKIKKELKDFDIVHRDKKGINVIVKFKDTTQKEKIIKYCDKNNYEYTLCPRYIRVLDDAISIEVKRLKW